MSSDQPQWQPPGGDPTAPLVPPPPPAPPGEGAPTYGQVGSYGIEPAPGPTTPQYSPPPAASYVTHQPGAIPLRPLNINDIYGGAIKAIRGNPAAALGLGLVVSALTIVPTAALGAWWVRSNGISVPDMSEADVAGLNATVGQILPGLGQIVAVTIVAAFMSWIVGQAAIGRLVTPAQVWEGTRRRIPTVFLTLLLLGVLLVVGFGVLAVLPILFLLATFDSGTSSSSVILAIFIVLGMFAIMALAALWLWTRLAFATSAVVLEEAGPWTAIRRSFALTKGSGMWRILGIRLLTAIITGIVGLLLQYPVLKAATAIFGGDGLEVADLAQLTIYAGAFSSVLVGVLITPFSSAVDSLLYIDQRMRREGLDVALLRAAEASSGRTS